MSSHFWVIPKCYVVLITAIQNSMKMSWSPSLPFYKCCVSYKPTVDDIYQVRWTTQHNVSGHSDRHNQLPGFFPHNLLFESGGERIHSINCHHHQLHGFCVPFVRPQMFPHTLQTGQKHERIFREWKLEQPWQLVDWRELIVTSEPWILWKPWFFFLPFKIYLKPLLNLHNFGSPWSARFIPLKSLKF